MKIEICNRNTNTIIHTSDEFDSIKDFVVNLVSREANLQEANLQGANLRGANLRGANLRGADLWGADLWGADLWGADLWGANLRGANLRGANLWEANLQEANLQGANLWGANLRGANLRGANLRGADGIYTFGGIGNENRMGYAWMEKGAVFFGLGCHFGNKKETIAAIQAKYGKDTTYEAQIKLAEKIMLEKYGEKK